MTVREQINFWNNLPEEELDKEVTVYGLTVEEIMKLKIDNESMKEQIEKIKCCGTCKYKFKDTCFLWLNKGVKCINKDKWECVE